MDPSFLTVLKTWPPYNLDASGQFQNCCRATKELQQKTGGMATDEKKHAAIGLNGCVLFS
jgi:hypothetical protein